ncbi:hypothetical protein ACHQM5_000219 [Ranunculus cassubicifolius]
MSGGVNGATNAHRFELSGPSHLTSVNWGNADDCRCVAATLVQSVYILERDRQNNRQGSNTLASPWWKFFHFKLIHQLVDDDDDPSIFGAVFEFIPPPFGSMPWTRVPPPRYVIAFRGTILEADSLSQDMRLNIGIMTNCLHRASRYDLAMQAVENMIAACGGGSNIWIAGHSLGSALGLLVGENMVNSGVFLQTYLFNPPFVSPPTEWIKSCKVKKVLRVGKCLAKAGLAKIAKNKLQRQQSDDRFTRLSPWFPSLFVHPADHICSGYIDYFEGRKTMQHIGAGRIERLAMQHSRTSILLNVVGKESEPSHLVPSACLTINDSPALGLKQAHEIDQWWRMDLRLRSSIYQY